MTESSLKMVKVFKLGPQFFMENEMTEEEFELASVIQNLSEDDLLALMGELGGADLVGKAESLPEGLFAEVE